MEDARAQCALDTAAGDVGLRVVGAHEVTHDFVERGLSILIFFLRELRHGNFAADDARLSQICLGDTVGSQPLKQVARTAPCALDLNVLDERLGKSARLKKGKPFGFVQEAQLKLVPVIEILEGSQFLARTDVDGGNALDLVGLPYDVALHAVTPT